ncbi:hypothetical protein MY3296_007077 [Beauveria thailandica]
MAAGFTIISLPVCHLLLITLMIRSIRDLRSKRPDIQKALAGLQQVLPDFGRKLPNLGKQQDHFAANLPRIRTEEWKVHHPFIRSMRKIQRSPKVRDWARHPTMRDMHNKTPKLTTPVNYDILPRSCPIQLD